MFINSSSLLLDFLSPPQPPSSANFLKPSAPKLPSSLFPSSVLPEFRMQMVVNAVKRRSRSLLPDTSNSLPSLAPVTNKKVGDREKSMKFDLGQKSWKCVARQKSWKCCTFGSGISSNNWCTW